MDVGPLRPLPFRQSPIRRPGSAVQSNLSSRGPRSASPNPRQTSPQEALESIFDFLAFSTRSKPVHICIEDAINQLLRARSSAAFFPDREKRNLQSPTLKASCSIDSGIVSLCYRSNQLVAIESPATHASFDKTVDCDAPSLYIPLCDARGEVVCVVRAIVGAGRTQFSPDNQADAERFARKMRNYIHLFVKSDSGGGLRKTFLALMEDVNARSGDVYIIRESGTVKFDFSSGSFAQVAAPGIAAAATAGPVFVGDVLRHKDYVESEDGRLRGAAVCVPVTLTSGVGVFVFRGDLSQPDLDKVVKRRAELEDAFREYDTVVASAPAEPQGRAKDGDTAMTYRKFLEMSESFNSTMNTESLTQTILRKAEETFAVAKVQMYVLDRAKKEIENQNRSRFSQSMGIAGHVITSEKEVVSDNIAELACYHPAVDSNGLQDICCIPLMNEKRVLFGCLELINRGHKFDDEELKLVRMFGVLVGVSYYNAVVYEKSFEISKTMVAKQPTRTDEEFTGFLSGLVADVIQTVYVDRCTIYRYNSDQNSLRPWLCVGGTVTNPTIFARDAITCLRGVLFNGDKISQFQQSCIHSVTNIHSIAQAVSSSKISAALDGKITEPVQPEQDSELNVCAFPLVSEDGQIIGALECASKSRVLPADMHLLDGFSFVVSELIARRLVKQRTREEIVRSVVAEGEDDATGLPRSVMSCPFNDLLSDSFNYHLLNEHTMFSFLFCVFNKFLGQSLERTALKNRTLIDYFIALSEAYSKTQDLSFGRAISRVQSLVHQLISAKIERTYEQMELLAAVVAALNYDLGRESLMGNAHEADMHVLDSKMKWYSSRACQRAVEIASEANLLGLFAPPNRERFWSLVCDLIASLEDWSPTSIEGAFDPTLVSDRVTVLKTMLKCSQFGPLVLRTKIFRVDKLAMCDWFFQHGDYTHVNGLVFAGQPEDRAHIDRKGSVVAVLREVALPLFASLAAVFGGLSEDLRSAQANIGDAERTK